MNFDFPELQALLVAWPSVEVPLQTTRDSLTERIRQILLVAKNEVGTSPWKSDLQPLIRHYLLRESARTGNRVKLRVPLRENWPSSVEWGKHGISALAVGDQAYVLTAEPWHPTWLEGGEQGVFSEAFTEKVVRREDRCDADPFITDATGYTHYSCPGQREAVRAAFLLKPGHTLIVNLPTGSGKSLVGQAPALVNNQEGKLTLFVVPTVSLAIDQARQMSAYFRKSQMFGGVWPLAWYGGLTATDRSEIRRRMREGTQLILFTSPEALTTSLLRSVFDVTRAGMLRYLVIDEAHLVTQWGDEFRPAFQALAGVRNSLLRQSENVGFRTLLLSATFTEETVETLANLFGPPEHVQMVSAVHLRPEPQYWFYHASSKSDKQERVLEALKHAPRPFVLYVTKREDAQEWGRILRLKDGLSRVACFDGNTPDREREKIINDWAGDRLDGVVATSAFGVGINKSDVRTIIHATIPETLDRFYQEVGRGGRDGLPSVSLLVYDDTDWKLPKKLAKPKIISDELGFNRWDALYESKDRNTVGDLIRIDLEASPKHLRGGSEYNVNWNMRTLILMSRAGLIALDVEAKDEVVDSVEEFSPSSPLTAMATVRIRIRNNGHKIQEVWERDVIPSRKKTLQAAEKNLHLMEGLLLRNHEISNILGELYRIRSTRWPVDVTRVCGGCPSDRISGHVQHGYHVPLAAPIYEVEVGDFHRWRVSFPWLDPVYVQIFYDDKKSLTEVQQLILKFLGWLVGECGVQELAADHSSSLVSLPQWRNLYRQARNGVLLHRDLLQLDEEPYTALARATIFDRNVTAREIEKLRLLNRPYHLVLLPESTPDPNNIHRLIADTASNSGQLQKLLPVLCQ